MLEKTYNVLLNSIYDLETKRIKTYSNHITKMQFLNTIKDETDSLCSNLLWGKFCFDVNVYRFKRLLNGTYLTRVQGAKEILTTMSENDYVRNLSLNDLQKIKDFLNRDYV